MKIRDEPVAVTGDGYCNNATDGIHPSGRRNKRMIRESEDLSETIRGNFTRFETLRCFAALMLRGFADGLLWHVKASPESLWNGD